MVDPPADLLNLSSTSYRPGRPPDRPERFRHRRRWPRLRCESLAGRTHVGGTDITLQGNFPKAGDVRGQRTAGVERWWYVANVSGIIRFAIAGILLGQWLI